MTEFGWLETRRPRPPEDLRARLHDVAGGPARERSDPSETLLCSARDALARTLSQPGRVRNAAFDLLVVDALVTYACEAALEGGDPDAVLDGLISIGRDT